jgi:putative methyltransferase
LTYAQYLNAVRSLDASEFVVDPHIPELLVFAANTEFHEHKLYLNGSIILQDKASCLPAVVLAPPAGSHVIDCCAAPGNKTTHLAAVMDNKGKIFAFDRDAKRLATMKTLLAKAGAQCVETSCFDFLRVDPHDPKYSAVEYILVDPSCSGSGIVSRLTSGDAIDGSDQPVLESRLKQLASFQAMILRHAMSFPSVHRVVYSTCSVHDQENECVVNDVLLRTGGAFCLVSAAPLLPCRGNQSVFPAAECCVRMTPESSLTNGFFVSCFERVKSDLKCADFTVSTSLKRASNGTSSYVGSVKSDNNKKHSAPSEPLAGSTKRRRKMNLKQKQKVTAMVGEQGFVSKLNSDAVLGQKAKKNKKRSKRSIKRPVTA